MPRSRYNSAPLAVLRRASKYPTLDELAKKVGIAQPTLSNIERGHKQTSDDKLRVLAKLLAVKFETVKQMHLQAVLDTIRERERSIEAELHGLKRRSA